MIMDTRTVIAILCGLALVGCAPEQDDIKRWMAQQEKGMVGGVKPLPEIKPFPVVAYSGEALASPFDSSRIAPEPNPDVEIKGGPDLTRPKEPLEAYPLESLNMVGVLMQGDVRHALVKVDNTLHQIRVGNYMGQNYGLVTEVQETEVTLLELVEDMNGDWVERTSKLLLQEQ